MHKGVPQTMDITSIKAVLHCLSNEILPSKFETAQQPEPNTIQLGFRGVNNLSWIEVSWQGDCARILKIEKPNKIGSTSTLAKQLSYGLKYMALVAIKQDKFERVIKFEFAKKPGDEVIKYLIFELMGKHSNIFYLDKNLKIIAAGKQIKSKQSSIRTVSTGDFYSSPPPTLKREPSQEESFSVWKKNLSLFPESLKDSLINNYQGTSPILIKQIEFFSNLEINDVMNKNIELIEDKYLKEIFKIWQDWINCFNNNIFNFSSFDNYFYSVWSSDVYQISKDKIELNNGLSNYYNYYLNLKKIEILIARIDSIIFKQTSTEKKNYNIQHKLLENSENHEEIKIKADNIFLIPNLNKQNIVEAENLYKKSKKLKRAKSLIRERLSFYKKRIDRLDEYNVMLENINSITVGTLRIKIDLLEELKEELCSEFNINSQNSKKINLKT